MDRQAASVDARDVEQVVQQARKALRLVLDAIERAHDASPVGLLAAAELPRQELSRRGQRRDRRFQLMRREL
jgi:hypothetical protein